MRQVEDVLNFLSDIDSNWWPFLFLRPEPYERMTSKRVALLAALYGIFTGAFMDALLAVAGRAHEVSLWTFPFWTTIGFFVIYRLTFAYAWNCRAERFIPIRTRS
ncbi:hypothetical protein [Pendulispora albinea]|uniref:Uncharacterized protein n=1 Tax=Pendulispora albinea TaxID=2741071 RepID=A0ABZ2LQK4_9BACT